MTIGLDPFAGAARGVTLDQYRAGMGEYLNAVADDAWAATPIAQIGRLAIAGAYQAEAEERRDRLLTADEANQRGRDLGLRFDQPIAQGAYDVIAGERQRQNAAESVFQRARLENGYGTLRWALAGGTEFLTQLADPLNIVSSFIPVVGEARYAMMAAKIGEPLATLAKGAIEGAVGQAMLEPIAALEQRQMGEEYRLLNTVLNLSMGAGFGVILHGVHYGAGSGFRFLRDKYILSEPRRPLPSEGPASAAGEPAPPETAGSREEPAVEVRRSPPPRQPVSEQMVQLHPATQEAALRTGVANLANDQRVDVDHVLAADPAWPQVQANIHDLQAHLELQRQAIAAAAPTPWTVPADYVPSDQDLAVARRLRRGLDPEVRLPEPLSLSDYVRSRGGLMEGTPEASDLRVALDTGAREKLIRPREKGGQDVEHLAQAAHEEGYPVPRSAIGSGVDVAGFMRALTEDATGGRRMRPDDSLTADFEAQQRYFDEIYRSVRDLGLDPVGMDARRLAYIMSRDEYHGRILSLLDRIDKLSDSSSLELVNQLDREAAELTAERLREPGAHEEDMAADHREFPPATLQDVEAFYELERAATREDTGGRQPLEERAPGGRPPEDRAAPVDRPGEAPATPEATGLRPEARPEGAQAAREGAPTDLAAVAERQQASDLHADFDELDRRDARLAAELKNIDAELTDAMATYGAHLTDEDRAVMAELERGADEVAKATNALAACKVGGA